MNTEIAVRDYIQTKTVKCPYTGTFMEGVTELNTAEKGKLGEMIFLKVINNKSKGTITGYAPNNGDNVDLMLSDGHRVEVKTSFGSKRQQPNKISGNINHIQSGKDYTRLVVVSYCMGENKEVKENIVWFDKADILKMIDEKQLKHQSGGLRAKNDDFSMSTNNAVNSKYAKRISEW